LFGAVAEEKEVNQITGKLQEARTTKSYDTFQILAQFVTEKCFLDLILRIQEVCTKSIPWWDILMHTSTVYSVV
jgi:U3 small nucleolar RNA-associated protein 20